MIDLAALTALKAELDARRQRPAVRRLSPA